MYKDMKDLQKYSELFGQNKGEEGRDCSEI